MAMLTPLSASICVPSIVHCVRSFAGTIMSGEFEALCGKYIDVVPMGVGATLYGGLTECQTLLVGG